MSTFYPENDYRSYLAHYGVRGMKWGVRKANAYDSIYYRSKYNNKRVKAYKDLTSGKLTKGQYATKRAGQMVNRYVGDPFRELGRGFGRNVRGWYRLLSGGTFRRTNEKEYMPNRERAYTEIKDNKLKRTLDGMVQGSLANNTAVAGSNGTITNIHDITDIADLLDRVQLKDIERIKFGT